MDNNALNFDFQAEKSDGSCIYRNWNCIYWEGYYAQNYLLDSGSTEISVYVDEKYVGTKLASEVGNDFIDCNQSGPLTFYDTIYYPSFYKTVKLIDQTEKVVFSQKFVFESDCNFIEISN